MRSLEEPDGVDIQKEIRRAIAKLRVAQEILAQLSSSDDDSLEEILQSRADALGNRLTRAELEVMVGFIRGLSAKQIAKRRELSERTISNQLRTGCHKLGFTDRRELKGWATAVSGTSLPDPDKE